MTYSNTDPAPSHQRAKKGASLVPTKRKVGRPPAVYDAAVSSVICERIAAGETLRSICTSDGMPTAVIFRRWSLARKELFEELQAARQLSADAFFDEALDKGRELARDPGTAQRVRAFDVLMSQLRWSAGKLDPQRYSDRSSVSFVVPIQIVTSLDLGQEGVVKSEDANVYEIKAEVVVPSEAAVDDAQEKRGVKG